MTNTIRKRLGPLSVVATIAVVGVLAAFIALAAVPNSASAQSTPPPPPPPVTPPPADNEAPVVASMPGDVMLLDGGAAQTIDLSTVFSDPDGDDLTYTAGALPGGVVSAAVSGSMLTITPIGAGSAVVTATASDGSESASVMIDVEVEVPVADRFDIEFTSADPDDSVVVQDPMGLASRIAIVRPIGGFPHTETVQYQVTAVDRLGNPLAEDATLSVEVDPNDDARILQSTNLDRAGLNVEGQEELEANLTIRATDGGTRSFDLDVRCLSQDGEVEIEISNKDLVIVGRAHIDCQSTEPEHPEDADDFSDRFTVTSYGDWEFHDVTDGFVIQDPMGVPQMINEMPANNLTGWMQRDEPVVSQPVQISDPDDVVYELGRHSVEHLTQRVNPQMGQHTVEVLVGASNVQLTVTGRPNPSLADEGTVYIRFVDKYGMPFGTDVDEEAAERGADVVGLDSQGKLNLLPANLSQAEALAYDQYQWTMPGNAAYNAYLTGLTGGGVGFLQGQFRFFDPCPASEGAGHYFMVEVYSNDGKYLETTETIKCVPSPRPGPTGLVFEIDSQIPGQGTLTYRHALNAASHTVLLVDSYTKTVVQTVSNAPDTVTFTNLNNGWEYDLVVVALGLNQQYTADAVTSRVRWLGLPDFPLDATMAPAPTGAHILCQTGQRYVMEKLADCDLGMPGNLQAMAGADAGTVNLTWTPGANSNMHYVAGIKVSDWQAQNYSNTIFRATSGNSSDEVTGLSSGEQYAFTVVSGRSFVDTNDQDWGDWATIVYATPN